MSTHRRSRWTAPHLIIFGTVAVLAAGILAVADRVNADAAVPGNDGKGVRLVTVGSNPTDVAVAPTRGEAYVVNDGSVSVVSLLTHHELAEVGTGFTDQTTIGVVNRGTRALIGTFDLPQLKVFNTETRKVTRQVTVGKGANDITAVQTKNGQFAYVSLQTDRKVAVVRTRDFKVVKRIAVPKAPQTVTTAPGGKTVWVGSSYSGQVWVVDTATRKITRHVFAPKSGPIMGVTFTREGKYAWVSGPGGLSKLDVKSGRTLAFVSTPKLFPGVQNLNPGGVAINSSGSAVMVVNMTFPENPAQGQMSVVDTSTAKVRRVIGLGGEPDGFAVDQRYGFTYVTNFQDDTVSYFRTPQ